MNRYPFLVLLLATLCLLNPVRAEIEFIYGIKERVFRQTGDSQPQDPVEWGFGAGASGDEQLTAVSVTPPGAGAPVVLSGEGGSFDLDVEGFSSQAGLDAAYPNGSLSFSVTDGGSPQDLGPFSIQGDGYPETPYFTNITDLYAHDLSQDFELSWNAFTGADAGDRILLQVWENSADEDVIFEFLETGTTRFVIPGGTLTADNAYDIEIVFVNETDGLETPDTIIGYLSTTSFYFTTYTSDTELAFYKWQRNIQTGPETINAGSPAYRPYATVVGQTNSVTYAEVVNAAGNQILDNTGSNSWAFTGSFMGKAELDSDYPAGETSFYLEENGTFNFYGSYYLPGDAYPEAPRFSNHTQLLAFNAAAVQTISWNAPPAGVDKVSLFIIQGISTVWSQNLDPGITSVELPAGTLTQDNNYTLAIRFWVTTTSSENPPASLGYMTSTAMGIQTSADGGGDPGIDFVYTVKERIFIQEGEEAPASPFGWSFGAGVEGGNNVSGGSLTHPGGSEDFFGEFGNYGTQGNDFQSPEALDAAFPDGSYSLNVTVDGSDQLLGPFDLSGNAFPPAPHLINPGDLGTHDFSNPFTIQWSAFTGHDPEDRIVLELGNEMTGEDLIFEFLPPDATSYEIPGGTFAEESQYEISVLFVNETDGLETPETIIGYLSRTNRTLSTLSSDTRLMFYKFRRHEQTGPDTLQDLGYLSLASVFGVTNNVTYAQLNTKSGSFPLANPASNIHLLNTVWDDKESMDAAYPRGEIQFFLEENGSSVPYAPYYLPPDGYPTSPVIQNFDELDFFDATQNRTVNWSEAPDGVTLVRVRVTTGLNQEVWVMDLESDATSVEIPADTLSQFNHYTLTIGFWSRVAGSEFPDASLGYTTTTFMSVRTVPPGFDFSDFQMLYFSQEVLNDPAIVGENADPDGDKLSNYLEFLLGADPNDSSSGLTYRVDGTILRISPIPRGASWELRFSGDLENWEALGAEYYEVLFDEIRIDLAAFPGITFIQLVFFDDP